MPSGRPLLTIVTDATCVPKTRFAFGTRVNRRQRQGIAFESLRIWRSANAANLTQAAAGESSQIHSKAPRPTTRLILQHHEGVDRDANAIPLFLIESLEVFASFLLGESESFQIGRFYKRTLSFFPIAPTVSRHKGVGTALCDRTASIPLKAACRVSMNNCPSLPHDGIEGRDLRCCCCFRANGKTRGRKDSKWLRW